MNKSSYFFGQSIFAQLISLIDSNLIKSAIKSNPAIVLTERFWRVLVNTVLKFKKDY